MLADLLIDDLLMIVVNGSPADRQEALVEIEGREAATCPPPPPEERGET